MRFIIKSSLKKQRWSNVPCLKLDAVWEDVVGAPAVEEEAVGVVEVLRFAVVPRPLHVLDRLGHGGGDCWMKMCSLK